MKNYVFGICYNSELSEKYDQKINEMFIEDIIYKYLKYFKLSILIMIALIIIIVSIDIFGGKRSEDHIQLKIIQSI